MLGKKSFSGTPRQLILVAFIFTAASVAVPESSSGQEIFSDGFESGNTKQWSTQITFASDGTYHFAVYDSLAFASGGNLVIADGVVEAINGTYFNFDEVDGGGDSECTLFFLWGPGLNPTAVDDFASGVQFVDSYPDGSEMTWTLSFSIEDNVGFSGTLSAAGASFTGADFGCNGSFPTLIIEGGKSYRSTQ